MFKKSRMLNCVKLSLFLILTPLILGIICGCETPVTPEVLEETDLSGTTWKGTYVSENSIISSEYGTGKKNVKRTVIYTFNTDNSFEFQITNDTEYKYAATTLIAKETDIQRGTYRKENGKYMLISTYCSIHNEPGSLYEEETNLEMPFNGVALNDKLYTLEFANIFYRVGSGTDVKGQWKACAIAYDFSGEAEKRFSSIEFNLEFTDEGYTQGPEVGTYSINDGKIDLVATNYPDTPGNPMSYIVTDNWLIMGSNCFLTKQ